jgi:beta-phosphoglucomutase-like phosphatase (HAD superfamily)
MYSVYEEAYTRAAKELGIAPRELQSVTWEAIRSLIEEQDKKSPEFRKDIDDIWKQVENKKIDRATGMKRVMERAGGYKKPDWVRPEDWGQENPDGSLKE